MGMPPMTQEEFDRNEVEVYRLQEERFDREQAAKKSSERRRRIFRIALIVVFVLVMIALAVVGSLMVSGTIKVASPPVNAPASSTPR